MSENLIKINTEKIHIFSPDIHVGFCIKINKFIDEQIAKKAVQALCEKHPLLTSTIYFDENHRVYYRLNSSKAIPVEFRDDDPTERWDEWMQKQNLEPFDLLNGPLMKILIINSGSSSTVVVIGHHMLGDGLSYLFFIRDFLLFIDDRLDMTRLRPPIIEVENDFPKNGRLKFFPKLAAKKLNRQYQKSGKVFSFDDYKTMYEDYHLKTAPAISLVDIDTSETEKIIKNCKKHSVTVNEAITTAFIIARKKMGGISNWASVSCNLRKELNRDPKESMGNFVSGTAITAQLDDSKDIWDNARQVGDALNKKLNNPSKRYLALSFIDALDDKFVNAAYFAGFGYYQNPVAKRLGNIVCGGAPGEGLGISNLGKHELKFDSFEIEECWFVPPLFPTNDFIVGVITMNQKMTFCLRYSANKIDQNSVEKIMSDVRNNLAA